MKKLSSVLFLFSLFAPLIQSQSANADVQVYIGAPPPPIIYHHPGAYLAPSTTVILPAPPPRVVVVPAPVVGVGAPLCPARPHPRVRGRVFYSAQCVLGHLDHELFYDPGLRIGYQNAIAGCRTIIDGVTFYRPGCVDNIRIGGVYFWSRADYYHRYYYHRYNHYHRYWLEFHGGDIGKSLENLAQLNSSTQSPFQSRQSDELQKLLTAETPLATPASSASASQSAQSAL